MCVIVNVNSCLRACMSLVSVLGWWSVIGGGDVGFSLSKKTDLLTPSLLKPDYCTLLSISRTWRCPHPPAGVPLSEPVADTCILEFAVRFSTSHRGCWWSCCFNSRFVGSLVGFNDSVVDVRFGSERCPRQLVHIV